jgi:Cytochrome P460
MAKTILVFAALVLGASAWAAGDELKFPSDYRHWFHVNSLVVAKESPVFGVLGGMHNMFVNSVGEAPLKNGGPYPDGTIFVTELHDFTVSEGSYAEGPSKGTGIMLKDAKLFAATGGWGFQFWAGGDPSKPIVMDPTKECFDCHTPKKAEDYVYSTYIP